MIEPVVVVSIDERHLAQMAGDCPAGVGRAARGRPQVRSQ
jgi:hypothetical protein